MRRMRMRISIEELVRSNITELLSRFRQGSCELYTSGRGLGAAKPPPDPALGEAWRGRRFLQASPDCKADCCQANPCLSFFKRQLQAAQRDYIAIAQGLLGHLLAIDIG